MARKEQFVLARFKGNKNLPGYLKGIIYLLKVSRTKLRGLGDGFFTISKSDGTKVYQTDSINSFYRDWEVIRVDKSK